MEQASRRVLFRLGNLDYFRCECGSFIGWDRLDWKAANATWIKHRDGSPRHLAWIKQREQLRGVRA